MPTPKLYGWMYQALSPINGVGDTWRKVLIVLSGVHEATSSGAMSMLLRGLEFRRGCSVQVIRWVGIFLHSSGLGLGDCKDCNLL